MSKELHFKFDAQTRLLRGASILANAVKITLGPKSQSVLIGKKWGRPVVCNDGVTIAKEIELKDQIENMGAQMLREVAEKTGEAVGDGTSTATIIAYAIFSEGFKNVTAGASAIDLKRGLDRGSKIAIEAIRGLSKKIMTHQEMEQVATISAHNDSAIGKFVADALEKVGTDGVVTVEEAQGTETIVEVVKGLQFDRGYLSPYFITDPAKMESRLDNPLILMHEKKIGSIEPLVPLLEQLIKTGRPLLVIADDVEREALAMMVVNKLRATLSCVAVKAPGFGDSRKDMLNDIAILTGGQFISEEVGMTLENVKISDLGAAAHVIVDKEHTTIIDGAGDKNAIADRVEQIRLQIKMTKSDYEKHKLEERLGKLSGGVAVIRAGAPSETELKSKKEALDDAISATKAAVAEGVVPGAGLTLLRAIDALEKEEEKLQGDEKTGIQILKHALEAPTRQIAENSGDDGGVVVNKMRSGSGAFGFDASKRNYVDLVQQGIIDPTKVLRVAIENAVSIASMLLLTQATLTDMKEDEKTEAHFPSSPNLESSL
ncbi:MAG: chaperonin GroEL [Bdellovibrio sp.]|nr:chaperonin GroEL [Bdellovibrio sp.]